ncbi:unnamed protein product, partial [Brenthis ino]
MDNPSGTSGPRVSDKRLAQTQAQVDEVVGIMRVNVEKVLERDQKLSELDNRADALQHGAAQFEQQAGKLKRKYWWQNLKMMLIIGAIGAVLLIIIIVWATSGSSHSASAPAPAPVTAAPAPQASVEPGR